MRRTVGWSILGWLMLVWMLGLPLLGQAATRGDVNEDGVIDGKDALKVLLVLEGRIPAPAQDASFWTLADIYPLPGTEGRMVGDGKVTTDDAYKLLSSVVGQVPRGEITGDFSQSPPQIDGLEPAQGAVSSQVTLFGQNFVVGNMAENIVLFKDLPARVVSSTGLKLVVEVPAGAESGLIRVLTPGGQAISPVEFTVLVVRPGQIVPSTGFKASDYELVNYFGDTAQPDADGKFQIPGMLRGINLPMALPKDGSDRILLGLDAPDASGQQSSSTSLSLLTTAQALVYLSPYFATQNVARAQLYLSYIQNAPEVAALAQRLDNLYQQTGLPFDEPQFEADYKKAISAIIDRLPANLFAQVDTPPGTSEPVGAQVESVQQPKVVQLDPSLEGNRSNGGTETLYPDHILTYAEPSKAGSIQPKSEAGNPVDWLVEFSRIDNLYNTFPHGHQSVLAADSRQKFPRTGASEISFLGSDSYLKYIDLFGVLFNWAWGVMTDAVTWVFPGLEGKASPDMGLHYAPNEEGVYVARVFSGALSSGIHAGEFDFVWSQVPDGQRDFWIALGMNVALAGIDFSSMFINVKEVTGAQNNGRIRKVLRTAVRKGIKLAAKKVPKGAVGATKAEWTATVLAMAYSVAQDIAGVVAADLTEAALKARVSKLLKIVGKSIDPLFKISMGAQAVERIVSLTGANSNVTPLETWLIIVGEPFTPKVTGIAPTTVGPGDEVALTGKHFDFRDKLSNDVRLGEIWQDATRLEVLSVNADGTRLVCRIPETTPREEMPIRIKTLYSGGSVLQSQKLAVIKRIPVLQEITPTIGFAASSRAGNDPFSQYEGTILHLKGRQMEPSQGAPADVVKIGGQSAKTVSVSRSEIQARVPALAPGTHEVFISSPEYNVETAHLSFTALGPPVLTSVDPAEAQPGQLVTLTGQNLGILMNEVVVRVDSTMAELLSVENTRLECRMPVDGSPGTALSIIIYTPAGKSSAKTIKRLAGVQAPPQPSYDSGWTIEVLDTSSGIQANGKISLDEAASMGRGAIDPFAQPWDDRDEKYTVHTYERKIKTGTDAQGKPIYSYQWEETAPQGPEYEPGHPGHEYRRYYEYRHAHADHGGGTTGPTLLSARTVDLDATDATMEEGDYTSGGTAGGANRGDWIRASDALIYEAGSLDLGDGDTLYMGASSTLQLSQSLTLHHGSLVELGTVKGGIDPLIAIKGHWNSVTSVGDSAKLLPVSGRGILVDGGIHNQVGGLIIESPGSHGIHILRGGINLVEIQVTGAGGHGIFIEGGEGNEIRASVVMNATGNGIHVEGGRNNKIVSGIVEGGTYGCVIKDGIGNRIERTTTRQAQQSGVHIQGGQSNILNEVSSYSNGTHGVAVTDSFLNTIVGGRFFGNSGDGVLLQGANTRLNTLQTFAIGSVQDSPEWVIQGNQKNGFHLRSGAHQNEVSSVEIYGSQEHGVLIEGVGTDGNQLKNLDIGHVWHGSRPTSIAAAKNLLDGVRIASGAQSNSLLNSNIGFSGKNGVTIQGAGTDNNRVENCFIGYYVETEEDLNDWAAIGPNGGVGVEVADGPLGSEIRKNILGVNLGGGIRLSKLSKPANSKIQHTATVADNWIGVTTDKKPINGTQGNGIHLIDSSDALLQDNSVRGHEVGLFIGGQASNSNSVDGGSSDGTRQQGILVQNSQNDSIRFFVYRSASHGLQLEGAVDTEVFASSFIENSGDGIYLNGAEQVSLYALKLPGGIIQTFQTTRNLGAGLHINASQDVSVFLGYFTANKKQGILAEGNSQNIEMVAVETNENVLAGIRLTGVHGVEIAPTEDDFLFITNGQAEGLIIHNSQNVTVGFPSRLGGNTFIDNISGNAAQGVLITGDLTQDIRLIGINFIGNNQAEGVRIEGGKGIYIGTGRPNQGNSIEMNPVGMLVQGANTEAHILGNVIGEPAAWETGTRDNGNGVGIQLQGDVGKVRIADNFISSNKTAGILLQGGAHDSLITHNLIQKNGTAGVKVVGAATHYNQITRNTITNNLGKGIELAGGNDQIEPPVIKEITWGKATVTGKVKAPKGSRVEIFSDPDDEGETFLGASAVHGDTFYLTTDVPFGLNLHGVVIHPDGNTSEFGPTVPMEDPARFAFTSTRDGNPEIYLIRPGSPNPVRLTQHTAPDLSPRLSPDGSKLLFTSDRSGNPDIWSILEDGTGLAQLTQDPAPEYDPAWSPAGDKFAYVSDKAGNPEIYVAPFTPAKPPGELSYDDGEADWYWEGYQPDNRVSVRFTTTNATLEQISFYVHSNPAEFGWEIRNWSGTRPGDTILAEGTTTPTTSGWHKVAVGPLQVPNDFVVALRTLTNQPKPRVGIDHSGTTDERTWSYSPGIDSWSVSTSGDVMIRAKFQVTFPNLTQNAAVDRYPAWSPDGKQIAFASERSGNPDIWLMNADGTTPTQLTTATAADYRPAWSPDGSRIAFVSERDGNPEIYVLAISGGAPTRITQHDGPDTDPAWTTDGKHLLFASDREGGIEIYSTTVNGTGLRRRTTSLGDNSEPDAGITRSATSQMVWRR